VIHGTADLGFATAEQIAGGRLGPRMDVGQGKDAAAKQVGDPGGIDFFLPGKRVSNS